MKAHTLAAPLVIAALGLGCELDDSEPSKDDVRDAVGQGDVDRDHCATWGWYEDEVCDEFCVDPDPACDGASCDNVGEDECTDSQWCDFPNLPDDGAISEEEARALDYSPEAMAQDSLDTLQTPEFQEAMGGVMRGLSSECDPTASGN